jgi:hypothetical protein
MSAFWDVMRWTGLTWWACAVIIAALIATRPYRARRQQPAVAVVESVPPPCPWCGSHECLDSSQCNCKTPCGSWLCVVKEPAGG